MLAVRSSWWCVATNALAMFLSIGVEPAKALYDVGRRRMRIGISLRGSGVSGAKPRKPCSIDVGERRFAASGAFASCDGGASVGAS